MVAWGTYTSGLKDGDYWEVFDGAPFQDKIAVTERSKHCKAIYISENWITVCPFPNCSYVPSCKVTSSQIGWLY